MRTFRSAVIRPASLALALAVFLAGTNYCLVAAMAGPGSRLTCAMQMPVASADADESAAPACHAAVPACHQAPAKRGGDAPARAASPPCCITLAPVASAPEAGFAPTVANELLALVGSTCDPSDAIAAHGVRAPLPLDTGPPLERCRSAASSRAPPLA